MDNRQIYYSSQTRSQMIQGYAFGGEAYSYTVVRDNLLRLLAEKEFKLTEILRPEIVKTPKAHELMIKEQPLAHIICKPFPEIRVLENTYNIGIIAWEFDKINAGSEKNPLPTNDYLRMLNVLDEVWVLSEYSRKVFNSYGLEHIYAIPSPLKKYAPAPVKEKADPRDILKKTQVLGADPTEKNPSSNTSQWKFGAFDEMYNKYEFSERPAVFISSVNFFDQRKNLADMIRSFAEFRKEHQNAVFIVKLIVNTRKTALSYIPTGFLFDYGVEINELDLSGVFLLVDYLTDEEYETFLACGDFYFCASHAEGQCFPLQEAMSMGVVPVSVDNTAMADYIDSDNAFVIPSYLTPIPENINQRYGFTEQMSWYDIQINEAAEQLKQAYLCTNYEEKSKKAMETIEKHCGDEAVYGKIKERLGQINGSKS